MSAFDYAEDELEELEELAKGRLRVGEAELFDIDAVAGCSLAPLVARYLRSRYERREITWGTFHNHWGSLRVLVDVHGRRPVNQVNVRTIEKWQRARRTLKASTRRTQWSIVNRFLDWLVRERRLRANPMKEMTPPRRPRSVPRALPEDDVTALLSVAPDARAQAIVWLMVGLGLRCIEVSRLRVEDWLRREDVILVRGKFDHERELPMTEEVRRAVEHYLAEHPATSGPLVRGYSTQRALRAGTVSHYLTEWMRAAGVQRAAHDGASAHALRHTAASDVLEECGDLRVVQQMLGHQHLSSTSVYLRRAEIKAMREAMSGRTYEPADSVRHLLLPADVRGQWSRLLDRPVNTICGAWSIAEENSVDDGDAELCADCRMVAELVDAVS